MEENGWEIKNQTSYNLIEEGLSDEEGSFLLIAEKVALNIESDRQMLMKTLYW